MLNPDDLLVTDSLLLLYNRNDSLYLETFRLPDSNRVADDIHFSCYWVCPSGIIAQNITGKGRIGLITPDSLIMWGEYPAPEKVDPRLADDPIAHARLYRTSR